MAIEGVNPFNESPAALLLSERPARSYRPHHGWPPCGFQDGGQARAL